MSKIRICLCLMIDRMPDVRRGAGVGRSGGLVWPAPGRSSTAEAALTTGMTTRSTAARHPGKRATRASTVVTPAEDMTSEQNCT
jgi:hypothetical protein